MRRRPRPSDRRRCDAGVTLVEATVFMSVLAIALLATSAAVVNSMASARALREHGIVADAARQVFERLRQEEFETVYARYNSVDGDDPGGAGTAPGRHFAVSGLEPRLGDADGLVGEIVFPEAATAGALSESPTNEFAGSPRDLNMDGDTSDADVSGEYLMLPVMVRLRWRGATGDHDARFVTVLDAGP